MKKVSTKGEDRHYGEAINLLIDEVNRMRDEQEEQARWYNQAVAELSDVVGGLVQILEEKQFFSDRELAMRTTHAVARLRDRRMTPRPPEVPLEGLSEADEIRLASERIAAELEGRSKRKVVRELSDARHCARCGEKLLDQEMTASGGGAAVCSSCLVESQI